jgi:peptide/nickel transport system permease protein
VIIAVLVFAALGAPWLTPFNPNEQFFDGLTLEGSPLPPSARFWFGTDTLGRDQFSRVIYGAGTSLMIGILANGAAVMIGTMLGVVAGYLKGIVGAAIMRFTDLMMAFPALLLGIALASLLKPSLFIVALVIALVNWVRHLVPHLVPTVLVYGTLGIATTVLYEATLSFLGVGVQPPTPSWGKMIFESQSYYLTAPWLVFIPGASILIVALAFNLVGDGLRDALDPTQRGRR